MKPGGYRRATLPAEMALTQFWPGIDPSVLVAAEIARFDKLKEAVESYLRGLRMAPILKNLGLTYQELYRAVRKCVHRHDDGLIFGWRALIPGMRVTRYERRKPLTSNADNPGRGCSGALQLIFKENSEVKRKLDIYLEKQCPEGGGAESRVTQTSAHSYFLALCREEGIPAFKWPFSAAKKGKGAVRSYFKKFMDDHYEQIVLPQYGERAQVKSKTGNGKKSRLLANFPYDVIEVDEHKAHFLGSIGIPTESGLRFFAITRVIIITVTDRRSGLVLGYHVVFRREARTGDLMEAIHNAITPWKKRTFSLKGLQYDDEDGFASGLSPSLENCGWAALLLDNALIHLADDVIGRVRQTVGCDVNFGPAGQPGRRAVGELVFKRLSENGFTRVPSTTGSNTEDPLRQEPEVKACKTRLHMNAVLDLVELAIAHYNGIVTKRAHGASALKYVQEVAMDDQLDFLMPQLPVRLQHTAPLNVQIITANITGSEKDGVRPRVYFANTYYTNEYLSNSWSYLGKEVRLHVDPSDVSSVKAYTAEGAFLGTLLAAEEWGRAPHTLESRTQVARLVSDGKLVRQEGETYVQAFLRTLKEQARKEGRTGRVSRAGTALAEELRSTQATVASQEQVVSEASSPKRQEIEEEPSLWPRSDTYEGPAIILPFKLRAIN